MSNPEWEIYITDFGYSDYMRSPQEHDQLAGDWAAAIMYEGIANGEAMWLEKNWVCPAWTSNSEFEVILPFTAWDDPRNPVVGNDTGQSVITNGDVEITINCYMFDGYTVMGLSPCMDDPNRITSHKYVMLQTYTIKNLKCEDIRNLSIFQMMHAHPNGDFGPNNYGVYDPTNYSDPHDDFFEFHYDMTFFAPYQNWSPDLDDVIAFSASVQPTAYTVGTFPSEGCCGGEPGCGSLHREVETDNLAGLNCLGPEEIAGVMKWHLGTLKAQQEVSFTVLLSTSHSDMGLPPEPVPEPTVIEYTGDAEGCKGKQAALSAQLTSKGENPISGKVINFQVSDQSCEAITNESGIATCLILLSQEPGDYMVTASFIGDNEYESSLVSQPFEITMCLTPSIVITACYTTDEFGNPDVQFNIGDTVLYHLEYDVVGGNPDPEVLYVAKAIVKPDFQGCRKRRKYRTKEYVFPGLYSGLHMIIEKSIPKCPRIHKWLDVDFILKLKDAGYVRDTATCNQSIRITPPWSMGGGASSCP
jgi:hypothetical protein